MIEPNNNMQFKRIVNIMPDEKFLDYYIEMSENFIAGQSSYFVLSDTSSLRHIRKKNANIIIVLREAFDQRIFLESLKQTTVLVFHGFPVDMSRLIYSIPAEIKKIWLFWGYDGYEAVPRSWFLNIRSDYAGYERSLISLGRFFFKRLKGSFVLRHNYQTRAVIKQMDYCATWIEADYLLAKKFNSKLKFLSFTYYTKELMKFDDIAIRNRDAGRLLLGNSGDSTNNHIEAMRYLHQINYRGEVICPLSYSGSAVYVDNVCTLGFKLFGSRFKPLKDFMPLNEYQEMINSCGIIWMNHKRQQAAGNILVSFMALKIVITNKENPMNSTFRKWRLSFFKKEILGDLNTIKEDDIAHNRKIILDKLTVDQNKPFFDAISAL